MICGMGNLPGMVCLNPVPEAHCLVPIEAEALSPELEVDGHSWKQCLRCETLMLADPVAWGSVAYCVDCWNGFALRAVRPPRTAIQARALSADDWGSPQR
jgi:hypothetical protein